MTLVPLCALQAMAGTVLHLRMLITLWTLHDTCCHVPILVRKTCTCICWPLVSISWYQKVVVVPSDQGLSGHKHGPYIFNRTKNAYVSVAEAIDIKAPYLWCLQATDETVGGDLTVGHQNLIRLAMEVGFWGVLGRLYIYPYKGHI